MPHRNSIVVPRADPREESGAASHEETLQMPELSALLNFLFLASREDTVAVFWEIKAIGIEASAWS